MTKSAPIISKFPQVDEAEASGELAKVYHDIHSTLRLPWVAFGIRVLSLFPAFVPEAWQKLKPHMSTMYAEKGADLIREASIIPGPPPPNPRPKLLAEGWSDEDINHALHAVDCLNYGNPKYILLITAWNEAWNERAAGDPGNSLSPAESAQLPYGLPDGIENFNLVDPDLATPDVQELMRQAKDLSLHHGVASDYRVLANWPDLLRIAVEDILRPVALTAQYEETGRRTRAIARKVVAGFPGLGGVSRRQMAETLSGPDIAGLTGLLFMYNRFMPDINLAMIRLRQAFDGAASATENKFPVS